jgi:hypothetical protein
MASGRLITRAADRQPAAAVRVRALSLTWGGLRVAALCALTGLMLPVSAQAPDDCRKPLYLTFDTGTLHIFPVGFQPEPLHCGENPALSWFEPIRQRRNGTTHKNSHGVRKVIILYLGDEVSGSVHRRV